MSLHSYLEKTYGSKPKKSKSKNGNSKNSSTRVEPKKNASLNIIDKLHDIPSPNLAGINSQSKGTKNGYGSKSLWKNLETNELVNDDATESSEVMLSSGAVAGLQTAEMVDKQIMKKQLAEQKGMVRTAANTKTVYRDSSGRRINDIQINLRMERENEQAEQHLKERKLKDLNKGEVQLLMQQKGLTLEQLASTSQKNEILSEDPAQQFSLSNNLRQTTINTSITGYKLYDKLYPENRFGIKPGYRWDGIDRSNGFEKKWFQKSNEVQEQKIQKYTMSNDM